MNRILNRFEPAFRWADDYGWAIFAFVLGIAAGMVLMVFVRNTSEKITVLGLEDQLTIGISSIALIVSLIAIRRGNIDSRRTLRAQMNNVVDQMSKVVLEYSKLLALPTSTDEEVNNRSSRSRVIVQDAFYLSTQADSLIKQQPAIMGANDYFITAHVHFLAADWTSANTYWEKAIKKSKHGSEFSQVIITRGYADVLFQQGRYDEGRHYYKAALEILDDTSDRNKSINGYTSRLWWLSESHNVLYGVSSEEHYKKAKTIYESISNPHMKRDGLTLLNSCGEVTQSEEASDIETN